MLKLKQLKFVNIGRFTEEQTIDFNSLSNLVQVDGQNLNTGGSSGSGKSTIFNALDYLLGLNDIANTTLQSRLTKEGISVSGLFDLDGKNLTISRIKGKLSIDFEGDLITGSSKLSEERLDQILGMPRHLFRPMLHKRQKEGGFFLQFTPRETYEFLTDCLGLSSLRTKLNTIEEKIKHQTDAATFEKNSISVTEAYLQSTQNAIKSLGLPPAKEIDDDHLLQLKTSYGYHLEELVRLEKAHAAENAQLEAQRPKTDSPPQLENPILDSSAFDRTAWDLALKEANIIQNSIQLLENNEKNRILKVKNSIQEFKLESANLQSKISLGANAQNEAVKIANDIKKIRSSICPICEQNWVTDTAKTKENELLAKLVDYKQQIADSKLAQERLNTIDQELIQLEQQTLPQVDPQLSVSKSKLVKVEAIIAAEHARHNDFYAIQAKNNKKIMDEHAIKQKALLDEFTLYQSVILGDFRLAQKALQDRQTAESTHLRQNTDRMRSLLEVATTKSNAYNESMQRYDVSIKNLKEEESKHLKALETAKQNLFQIEQYLSYVEELRRAIKSFVSCSFDDALEAIGDSATRIIRNIPNMANATIQLEGLKETKEGKVKEEVNAVISVDGEVGVPIKSLSGGERSAVDLAVDLAVVDLIENSTGFGCDLMILDEPFTGLDTTSIEMVLELLRNSNTGKRLILIDHNEIVKEMVQDKIIVCRDGINSKILQ